MKEIFNPNLYHGLHKDKNFFEGWYFKIVDRYNSYKLSIIPGISYGYNNKENHSFIQIVNGHDVKYDYIKYPVENFKFNNNNFRISINSNIFTMDNMNLYIHHEDIDIKGNLIFKNTVKWPGNILNPGSMGFYNYLKFMECYSQVCILNGSLIGSLEINGNNVDFTGGKIYIEKNWGKSFPKSWLWIQCNSFKNRSASVSCSLGEVPFLTKNFKGFLIGITIDRKFISFTSINRSKIKLKRLGDDIVLTAYKQNLKLTLKTTSNKKDFVLCKGPKNGVMAPLVKETLNGKVYMLLEDTKTKKKLFEDIGVSTGIEYGGSLMDEF